MAGTEGRNENEGRGGAAASSSAPCILFSPSSSSSSNAVPYRSAFITTTGTTMTIAATAKKGTCQTTDLFSRGNRRRWRGVSDGNIRGRPPIVRPCRHRRRLLLSDASSASSLSHSRTRSCRRRLSIVAPIPMLFLALILAAAGSAATSSAASVTGTPKPSSLSTTTTTTTSSSGHPRRSAKKTTPSDGFDDDDDDDDDWLGGFDFDDVIVDDDGGVEGGGIELLDSIFSSGSDGVETGIGDNDVVEKGVLTGTVATSIDEQEGREDRDRFDGQQQFVEEDMKEDKEGITGRSRHRVASAAAEREKKEEEENEGGLGGRGRDHDRDVESRKEEEGETLHNGAGGRRRQRRPASSSSSSPPALVNDDGLEGTDERSFALDAASADVDPPAETNTAAKPKPKKKKKKSTEGSSSSFSLSQGERYDDIGTGMVGRDGINEEEDEDAEAVSDIEALRRRIENDIDRARKGVPGGGETELAVAAEAAEGTATSRTTEAGAESGSDKTSVSSSPPSSPSSIGSKREDLEEEEKVTVLEEESKEEERGRNRRPRASSVSAADVDANAEEYEDDTIAEEDSSSFASAWDRDRSVSRPRASAGLDPSPRIATPSRTWESGDGGKVHGRGEASAGDYYGVLEEERQERQLLHQQQQQQQRRRRQQQQSANGFIARDEKGRLRRPEAGRPFVVHGGMREGSMEGGTGSFRRPPLPPSSYGRRGGEGGGGGNASSKLAWRDPSVSARRTVVVPSDPPLPSFPQHRRLRPSHRRSDMYDASTSSGTRETATFGTSATAVRTDTRRPVNGGVGTRDLDGSTREGATRTSTQGRNWSSASVDIGASYINDVDDGSGSGAMRPPSFGVSSRTRPVSSTPAPSTSRSGPSASSPSGSAAAVAAASSPSSTPADENSAIEEFKAVKMRLKRTIADDLHALYATSVSGTLRGDGAARVPASIYGQTYEEESSTFLHSEYAKCIDRTLGPQPDLHFASSGHGTFDKDEGAVAAQWYWHAVPNPGETGGGTIRSRKLYGGAQYHRLLGSLHSALMSAPFRPVSSNELALLLRGIGLHGGGSHDGPNALAAVSNLCRHRMDELLRSWLDALSARVEYVLGERSWEVVRYSALTPRPTSPGSSSPRREGKLDGEECDRIEDDITALAQRTYADFVRGLVSRAHELARSDLDALVRYVSWEMVTGAGDGRGRKTRAASTIPASSAVPTLPKTTTVGRARGDSRLQGKARKVRGGATAGGSGSQQGSAKELAIGGKRRRDLASSGSFPCGEFSEEDELDLETGGDLVGGVLSRGLEEDPEDLAIDEELRGGGGGGNTPSANSVVPLSSQASSSAAAAAHLRISGDDPEDDVASLIYDTLSVVRYTAYASAEESERALKAAMNSLLRRVTDSWRREASSMVFGKFNSVVLLGLHELWGRRLREEVDEYLKTEGK